MNNFTLIKGQYKVEFAINHVKYFIGNNYQEKYKMIQTWKEFFINSHESEYSKSKLGVVDIKINGQSIYKKDSLFFFVNQHYSLTDDMKLTTKSLVSKYLECIISDINNVDVINTINILFQSFSNEIDDSLIKSSFPSFVPKLFLKLITPYYVIDDEQANEYDMTYNDIILLQLKMIEHISKIINKNPIVCVLEVPELTVEIQEYIEKIESFYVIVFTQKYQSKLRIEDVFLCDIELVDLFDENTIYNLFVLKGVCTIEEAKIMIKNMLEEERKKFDLSIMK